MAFCYGARAAPGVRFRAQRETAAPSAFEKETWKQGEQSAPRAQAGPAFLSVYPFRVRGFFIEKAAGLSHRVGAGNSPASHFGKETAEHAAWMAACLCYLRFCEDRHFDR